MSVSTPVAEELAAPREEPRAVVAAEPAPLPLAAPKTGARVVAIDVLRGFDMIWILGADNLARKIGLAFKGRPWADELYRHFTHTKWEGLTFYDLIFPTFVFVVGASLVFSLTKLQARGGTAAAVRRVIFRSLALFALGIFYNGGLSKPWPDVRLAGVLPRLAVCYFVVSLLFLFCSRRTMAIVLVSLLVVYWGVMSFVRMPGEPKASFAEGHNVANWIDGRFLPGRKYDATPPPPHDPEGLLSTVPAVATCLLGVFAGLLLQSGTVRPWKKVGILILGGAALTAIGYLWGLPQFDWRLRFPIIKKLWTSSYVLVAGGYASMALGVCYLLMDVWGAGCPAWSKLRMPPLFVWLAQPFVWVGMNAITLYVLVDGNLIKLKDEVAPRLVGGSVSAWIGQRFGEQWPPVVVGAVAVLLMLMIARFLYKRQIFLRV